MPRIRSTSEVATERTDLERALHALIEKYRPTKLIETGAFHGTGTTKYIASALKDAGLMQAKFFSIEVNPNFAQMAIKNLQAHGLENFAVVLNGLSIPRSLLPTQEAIEERLVKGIGALIQERDLFADHNERDRAFHYFNETNHAVPDDLLGRCLTQFNNSPELVLLDSAGHIGQIEFQYVLSCLHTSCHIVLDDIYHVKHCQSFRQIKSDPRFTVETESAEQAGFCVAKFAP